MATSSDAQRRARGVLIDPGDEVDALLEAAAAHRLQVRYILLTHAHLDHITGVARAKGVLKAPIVLHEADLFLYDGIVQQGRAFGFDVEPQPPVDLFYTRDMRLRFGHYTVDALHTPGHCPGGVCLVVARDRDPAPTLFVGDTLFAGSIGRTDLPGGDPAALMRSIREVLLAFPDETLVCSGHGEPTSIGRERRENPFLRSPS